MCTEWSYLTRGIASQGVKGAIRVAVGEAVGCFKNEKPISGEGSGHAVSDSGCWCCVGVVLLDGVVVVHDVGVDVVGTSRLCAFRRTFMFWFRFLLVVVLECADVV